MRWFVLIICFLCTNSLIAQLSPGISFGVGNFIKHTPKIQIKPESPYIFGNLSLYKEGSDSLSWNKYWSVSKIQHSISYISFGEAEVLGYSLAYIPGIQFSIWEGETQSFEFGLNSGISWHSKVFDSFENPTNNLISSRFNSTSRFTFHWNWNIKKQYILSSGVFLHHYSNCSIKSPNLGYNAFGLFSTLQILPQQSRAPRNYLHDPFETQQSRWKYYIYVHYGAKESGAAPNGPLFKMGAAGTGVMYHINHYFRLLSCIEYEWNGVQFAFFKSNLTTNSTKEAVKLANSWMIAGGFELLFGPIGLRFSPGIYLQTESLRSFNRMGVYYYFNIPKTSNLLAIGVSLKNHYFDAHYGALTISYQL